VFSSESILAASGERDTWLYSRERHRYRRVVVMNDHMIPKENVSEREYDTPGTMKSTQKAQQTASELPANENRKDSNTPSSADSDLDK
jgi:hypothetical protein